jgi:large subunit ribosomal protein L13e
LNDNVKRLKLFVSKLVLFPRVAGKPKNGVVKDSANDVVA